MSSASGPSTSKARGRVRSDTLSRLLSRKQGEELGFERDFR